ncbi:MAG: class I SAM-dependent methyltransferase [Candidatus Woesearchaeota archaeon]
MASFDFYNDLANSYDELYKEEQFRKYFLVKEYIGKQILDLGCGTGLFLEFLLENKIKFEKYVGIDLSKKLINIAKKKHKTMKNVEFILADATSFDYSKLNVNFDTIVSFTALHNMSSIDFLTSFNFKPAFFIFTLLKKSKRFEEYKNFLKNNFKIMKEIDDYHDNILILKNK